MAKRKLIRRLLDKTLWGLVKTFSWDENIRTPYTTPHYDAAKRDKLNRDWRPALTSADQAILGDLDSLISRSRSMLRNEGVSRSSQNAYKRYVIGSGITAKSTARHPKTKKKLEVYNEILDREWRKWTQNPNLCDAERTKIFEEKQALWMNEEFAAGGLFIIMNYRPHEEGVGLVLQEVEYEQVDQTIREYEGNKVRRGIEIDMFGAPVAYHLFTSTHPTEEWKKKSSRILAERVIHIFRQDRIRQKYGTPWMDAVMPAVRTLAMYEQFMSMKARTEAAYHGVVEQTGEGGYGLPSEVARQVGAAQATSDTTTDTTTNNIEMRVQPGLFPVLRPGQQIKWPTPATPNTMYGPFVTEQLKRIAAGVGMDLATVSRWYGDTNFSAQKMAKLDVYAETDPIQNVLIKKVLYRIRNTFIEMALMEKRLKAVGYFEHDSWKEAYRSTNWQGPAKQSVEPLKDAMASIKLQEANLESPDTYFNRRGENRDDVYSEIQDAKEDRKARGIEVEKPVVKNPNAPLPNKNKGEGTNGNDVKNNRRIFSL
tara:strand:+ start:3651 stop:5267 length:1617 start_codon:yes stop_codon:yes gene_type:complete